MSDFEIEIDEDRCLEAATRMDLMLDLQYIIPKLEWRKIKDLKDVEIQNWAIQVASKTDE